MVVFEKNIFSVPTPVFSPVSASEKRELIQVIETLFGEFKINEVLRVGAMELNSNNWKVETENGDFILKRSALTKLETLTHQALWTSQLSATSYPTVQFIPSKSGALLGSDSAFSYCLTRFKKGTYYGGTLGDWTDLLSNLKKLFDYSLSQTQNFDSFPKRSYFTADDDKLVSNLKNVAGIEGIKKEQLTRILTEYERAKIKYSELKHAQSVFHVDVHPHNLIFNDSLLNLLTDFESFQLTDPEISLGFGLYKCMRQLFTLEEFPTSIDQKKMAEVLKNEFETFFPQKNLANLLIQGKADVLKRLLYILKELTESGNSKWAFMFPVQFSSLDEIDELEKLVS